MLFAFIDESYTADRYYVGALVVHVDDIGDLSRALSASAEYATGFGVPLQTEFHGHRIMTGRDGWESIQGQTRSAAAIYRHALRGVAQVKARLYIEGVDIARLNARYRYPDPPHLVTLRHVLEQVNASATMRGETEVVICDEVQGSDGHKKRLGEYQNIGTPGYRSSRLQTLEQIMFADSSASPGLQAIDLAVYLYRRIDAHLNGSERSHRLAVSLFDELRPVIARVRRWDP